MHCLIVDCYRALSNLQYLSDYSQQMGPEEAHKKAAEVFADVFSQSQLMYIPLMHQLLKAEQTVRADL